MRPQLSYANIMSTVAAVAAIGGGTLAIAAVPDKQGKINACYVKSGKRQGQVRLLVKGTKCRKGEKKVAWNQKGVQGDTGTPGTPGTPGAPGAPGAPGQPGSDAQFNGAAAGGDLQGTYPNPTLKTLSALNLAADGQVRFGDEVLGFSTGRFTLGDDVDVAGTGGFGGDVAIGNSFVNDDDSLYFDGESARMFWQEAASDFNLTHALDLQTFLEVREQSGDPAVPSANRVRIYAKEVGGETRLFARFNDGTPDGAIVELAQP